MRARPRRETPADPEENRGIEAVHTNLGQFWTTTSPFDPITQLGKFIRDPELVVDFRTPRLDRDPLCGGGPGDQPYLYDGSATKLLLGKPLSGNQHDPSTSDRFLKAAPQFAPRSEFLRNPVFGTAELIRAALGR